MIGNANYHISNIKKKKGVDLMDCLRASDVDCMQLMRIAKHPIRIQDDLIVVNDLEHGNLKLYECDGGPMDIHLLFSDVDEWKNAALVAKITIDISEQNDYVVIRSIFCEKGFEHLAAAMIDQVISYAKFYASFKSVRISENKKERWFFYAASVLKDFIKKDEGYCECCLAEKAARI